MRVDSIITIKDGEISRKDAKKLLTALTYFDAEGIEVMAYDYVAGRGELRIPRGAWNLIPGIDSVDDFRSSPPQHEFDYTRELDIEGYEGQKDAIAAMFENEQGQIIAPPGRGKTEIALAFAAQCCTPTLVVVHTADLFKQWVDRAKVSVPGMTIGEIRGQKKTIGNVTIAMAQTLKRYVLDGGAFWRQFGCTICDEGHHAAADTWEWILNVSPSFYRFAFTATERRADGRHPSVRFNVGPIIHKIAFESQVPIEIQPVATGFGFKRTVYRGPHDWTRMCRILSADQERNRRIAENIVADVRRGHTVLGLSRQIKHLEHIYDEIKEIAPGVADATRVVTGRNNMMWRTDSIDGLRNGEIKCILATQLADEGLDVPRLSRVHLTFPGKHDGRIIQQIGRAIRKHVDKVDALVYDYVDDLVPPLSRQYLERCATYKKLGLKVRTANGWKPEAQKRRLPSALYRVASFRGDQSS